jgi:hypothetical protein
MPNSSRVLPRFSSSNFTVLRITFRSMIRLELLFVQGEKQGSSFSLIHVDIHFPTPFL